jgi:hypothetical protein
LLTSRLSLAIRDVCEISCKTAFGFFNDWRPSLEKERKEIALKSERIAREGGPR